MINSREERVDFVLKEIKRTKPHVIVIDGPCASGKTTLVDDLRKRIDFSIVRMDDFFLPPGLRTLERCSEKGGNIHYERFIEEVIRPIEEKRSFSYRRFSCATLSYSGLVDVDIEGLIVVEGSYSLHPKFPPYWDLSFFLTVDEAEQIRRLSLRSGEKLNDFLTKWIPLEREYFDSFAIEKRASFILQHSSFS